MRNSMVNYPPNIPITEDPVLWSDKQRPLFGQPLSFTRYTLYSDRLLVDRGIITFRQEEVRLYKIRDVTLRQTIFQRLFGVGTIRLDTMDVSGPRILLQDIKNPQAVRKMLSDTAEWERQRNGIHYVDGFGGIT